MIAKALLVLVIANAARAQVSTASLFPVGFMDDDLRGEAIGTGAGGTTYALSGTFSGLDIPYTLTMAQDDSRVSITADLETAGITVPIDVQCTLGGGDAVCRQVVGEGLDATTFTESGAVFLTPVPVGPGADTVSVTATTRSASATFSSDPPLGTGTEDVLPPSISIPTGTGIGTITEANGPEGTDGSLPGLPGGALGIQNGFIAALGMIVPAVLSAVILVN